MKNKEQKIEAIEKVLIDYEDQISDGYAYYSDTKKEAENKIREIAEKILEVVKEV